MTGLDTNVLVRFLVADDAEQAARATAQLKEIEEAGDVAYLTGIVLCETVWVLDRGYGYAKPVIVDVLERILLTRQLEVEDRDGAWRALEAYRAGRADFADYLIGERNRAGGCERTVTFDLLLEGAAGFQVLQGAG